MDKTLELIVLDQPPPGAVILVMWIAIVAGVRGLILVKPDCVPRSNVCPREATPGAQW